MSSLIIEYEISNAMINDVVLELTSILPLFIIGRESVRISKLIVTNSNLFLRFGLREEGVDILANTSLENMVSILFFLLTLRDIEMATRTRNSHKNSGYKSSILLSLQH